MKKMRKIVATILAMLMLAAVMVPTAFAADEEMIVAYIQVPEDWQDPAVWAWDDEGNNAFAAWPGGAAEADPNNEGWYYCWLPAWANNIIVNANEGSVQTNVEIKIESQDVWITVASPDEATFVYEAQTQGEAPAYVEKIAVHARIPDAWGQANLWAWLDPDGTNAFAAWPGEAMTADDAGWYTAQVPAWVNSVIINAGEGNPQTEDLTIEPQEMWVVVADDGTAEVLYENPDLAVANITVHVKVPGDWLAPNLWAWSHPDGTNVFSAWPGEPLAAEGDWLTMQVPGWINMVIVNANEGTVQTTDIEVEVGKDIWLVVDGAESFTVTYEEPADAPAPDAEPSSTAALEVSSQTAAPANEGGINIWLIVGIAAGVVVIIVVIAIVVAKKKKNK